MVKLTLLGCLLAIVPGLCLAGMGTAPVPVEHHGTMVPSAASSTHCLTCHGPEAGLATRCDPAASHRSDRPFPPAGGKKFAPATLVTARGLRLPDGVITCLTCHDLSRPQPPHLALPMTDSALCLACHTL